MTLSIPPDISEAERVLHASFGYPAFRPGQTRAVEAVLGGRDTLVVLPTGGGKSLCYQVPALMLPGLTVVVSPLISLMKDQVDTLERKGIPAAFINSTLTSSQVSDRMARAQSGELKLLYVAPERFDAGSAADRLRAIGVSLLAVDEAHCISEWGHDFRPSYLRVGAVRKRLGSPVTIALTATATAHVRSDIARLLELREPQIIITGFDRTNLHYHVIPARTDDEKDREMVDLVKKSEGVAIVYAPTRKTVERVSRVLDRARIAVAPYHAGLDDTRRREVQDAFMKEKVRAIVATNAFGMGIDKPNVRLVVHHAMPGTLEAYYQEAGRAGRDGLHSECVLLHGHQDRFMHEFFIKGAHPDRKVIEKTWTRLCAVADQTALVSDTPESIASRIDGKVSTKEVESAMRILLDAGALVREDASFTRVYVRLLATPDRIKRELGDGREMERELLRALWRAKGKALERGTVIDLDGLPPGFGGSSGCTGMLDALQDEQFLMWQRTGGGLRLVESHLPVSRLPVDWDRLARRRSGEMAKLDAMQKYAYASGCRRSFVLRYFGDPAARPQCEGCDNCLGLQRARPAAKPAKAKRSKFRAPISTDDVVMSEDARRQREAPVVGASDAPLFAALRALRSELARASKVPAYVIFSDRTLAEIATRRPQTVHALANVNGVGPTKLERYGDRVIEIVRAADTD